jgi:uncharacterized protein YecA (UPF0149 family)
LERHYALVKQAASDPDHPAYDELQEILAKNIEGASRQQPASQTDPVGRNAPCPCGSGRKYKRGCMRQDR